MTSVTLPVQAATWVAGAGEKILRHFLYAVATLAMMYIHIGGFSRVFLLLTLKHDPEISSNCLEQCQADEEWARYNGFLE